MNDDGEALLCDFGLSRVRHEKTRTLTGTRAGGSLRYLAPELIFSDDHLRSNEASDIYALAMTFLALGTLQHPFTDIPNEQRAIRAAEQGRRPSQPEALGCLGMDQTSYLWLSMEMMWHHEPRVRPGVDYILSHLLTLALDPPQLQSQPSHQDSEPSEVELEQIWLELLRQKTEAGEEI